MVHSALAAAMGRQLSVVLCSLHWFHGRPQAVARCQLPSPGKLKVDIHIVIDYQTSYLLKCAKYTE